MKETTCNITVPEALVCFLELGESKNELTRNALFLYPYVKNGTISHGKAAEILGIHKWDLIELYNNQGLPYFDMPISELEEEVATYTKLLKQGK